MLRTRVARRPRGFTMVELLTVMFIISTLAAIVVPNLRRAVDRTKATACLTNIETISRAVVLYANDNNNQFPPNLDALVPNYLGVIPSCPVAPVDSYRPGYSVSAAFDNCTQVCKGLNHGNVGLGVDQPFFDPAEGVGPQQP